MSGIRFGSALHERDDAVFSWPATVLLAALTLATFAQGGFYRAGSIPVGAMIAGGLLLAHRASSLSLTDVREPVLVSLGALGLWTVVSATLAGDAGASLPVLALLAAMTLVLVIVRRSPDVERVTLAHGIIAVGTLVALTGLVGVAFRIEPLGRSVQHLWRAEGALTYANALGGLVAIAALIAIALSARAPSPVMVAATTVLLASLASSMSRGAIIAFMVGLTVASALLGIRAIARAATPAFIGAAIAFGALLPSVPERTASRPVLAIGGLMIGVAIAAGLARARPRALGVAIAAAVIGGAGLVAVFSEQTGAILDARWTLASLGRSNASAAAMDVFIDSPVTGAGPGRAALMWMENGRYLTTRYVHNEYLQSLAELGVIGAALLAMLFVAGARALRHRSLRAREPALWAGVVAALSALAVHSGMDFLWHIPVFPLLAMALFGLVTTTRKEIR